MDLSALVEDATRALHERARVSRPTMPEWDTVEPLTRARLREDAMPAILAIAPSLVDNVSKALMREVGDLPFVTPEELRTALTKISAAVAFSA